MDINYNVQKYINRIKEACNKQKPLVAIQCIAYNHEKFIRDALEGFIMQKTSFPFVAIVHDDKSTDNTAAIIREYAEKYPDIIKPIFEEDNQYSKHDGSLNSIMKVAVKATGAKYIAYCEGDDYWIDSLKLQKQVDALVNDKAASGCYTGFITVDERGELFDRPFSEECQAKSFTGNQFDELIKGNYVQTCTFLIRRSVIESNYYKDSSIKFDYTLSLTASYIGKLIYIDEKTSAYRVNPQGMTCTQLGRVTDMCGDVVHYFWGVVINENNNIIRKPSVVRYFFENEWDFRIRYKFTLLKDMIKVAPFPCIIGAIKWASIKIYRKAMKNSKIFTT